MLSPRTCRIYHEPSLGITGFTTSGRLTHRSWPTIRFLFVRSWLWLRLPPDPSLSRGTRDPSLRITVPIPWTVEDFHLREWMHARRTTGVRLADARGEDATRTL